MSIKVLCQEDRSTAIAYLGMHRELIRDGFAVPHPGSLRGVRAFIRVADFFEDALLVSMMCSLTVPDVETAWRSLHAVASKQLRPLLEFAERSSAAVTPLARELLADSVNVD